MKHLPPAASVTPWLYWSIFPVHRAFLKLYFGQIVIKGLEYLPESGSVVLAPKHFSRWDPLVLALLSTEPLQFMTNANQFEGFQGWLIQRLGAFPVDLNHPKVSSFCCAIELPLFCHSPKTFVISKRRELLHIRRSPAFF
jgi:1-acyl-sn-glycerol-3-phosphate acyltransferase